jgi:hypothetical protein
MAQTMQNVLFGPVHVVSAYLNPPCRVCRSLKHIHTIKHLLAQKTMREYLKRRT